jgi:serine/threonine-protein kinase
MLAPPPTLFLEQGMEPYPGFHLTTFLGRGGWGEVWKATRSDGAAFALKFLPSEASMLATQEIRALQTLRQLQHPNLLRVDNIWSCPRYLVIVMELAEGSLLDLMEVCQAELRGGMSIEHACFFLLQAAQAIDFINTRQHMINGQRVAFRHCDIKPSNLLVVGNTVKVADFSLSVQTTTQMWYHRRAGTPPYAAPEVQRGWLSDRSDQFSLAVSYFQLRTRSFPFEAPTSNQASSGRQVVNLSALTAAEQPILARAMATVPQDRWPSCVEMINRLAKCNVQTNRAMEEAQAAELVTVRKSLAK